MKGQTNNKLSGLTGRLQGLPLTFTHRLGGKWSSWGQLVSDKQNLEMKKRNYRDGKLKRWQTDTRSNLFLLSCHFSQKGWLACLFYHFSCVKYSHLHLRYRRALLKGCQSSIQWVFTSATKKNVIFKVVKYSFSSKTVPTNCAYLVQFFLCNVLHAVMNAIACL